MAKKRWAHATISDQYILQEGKKRKRLFFIWEVLKLRRIHEENKHKRNPDTHTEFNYDDLTFWSTQKGEHNKKPLTPDIRGYFRYKSGDAPADSNQGGDGESITHQLAILALSQLDKIPFVINGKKLTLDFMDFDLDGEDTRIQIGGGKYFYPDLIGYLVPGSCNYEKWGGKVLIEVKVTHGCEPAKVNILKEHNFAILEVYISPKFRFPPEVKGYDFDAEDMERYFNRLVDRFSQETFATLLSNPMVTDYAESRIKSIIMDKQSVEVRLTSVSCELEQTRRQLTLVKGELQSFENQQEHQDLAFKQAIKAEEKKTVSALEDVDKYKTRLKHVLLLSLFVGATTCALLLMPVFLRKEAVALVNWYFHLVG
jgi:hypothetical protein